MTQDLQTQDIQTKVMGAEEVRREWRTVVDSALAGEDIVVERYARPAVVVIAYEDYTAIRQELEELRATRRANQLRVAMQQSKNKALSWHKPTQAKRAKASQTPNKFISQC